jgi:nascent polypeptide-associated complex subunit beta
VKVFLGLGDDPGTNYNVTLRPMFTQEGLGNFCIGGLSVEGIEGVEVQDGTNATLQVVTNGDPEGGLFQVIFLALIPGFSD